MATILFTAGGDFDLGNSQTPYAHAELNFQVQFTQDFAGAYDIQNYQGYPLQIVTTRYGSYLYAQQDLNSVLDLDNGFYFDFSNEVPPAGYTVSIKGGALGDVLIGSGGNDILEGAGGADQLAGGQGVDTVTYVSSTSGVTLSFSRSIASTGDAAGDYFNSIELYVGSTHDDLMIGDGNVNNFNGGDGRDLLRGRGGDDILAGGYGKDTLQGGTGADAFVASYGTNQTGGGDRIIDFSAVEGDRIDLRQIVAIDRDIVFIGNDKFVSGSDDTQIRFVAQKNGNTLVQIDNYGDGLVDTAFYVIGTRVDQDDFILPDLISSSGSSQQDHGSVGVIPADITALI